MEEYGLFIHGTASGVASVAAWEALRCVFAGPSLIFIGMVGQHGCHPPVASDAHQAPS